MTEGRDHAIVAAESPALEQAAGLMRQIGWQLAEVSVNAETGFVRVVAETRGEAEGVIVTLLRSSLHGCIIEMRDRTHRKPGMFKHYWEIGEHLGRRRFDDIREATAAMLQYACDNGPSGALGEHAASARQALLDVMIAAIEAAPRRKEGP
jgi:hypothetical protein